MRRSFSLPSLANLRGMQFRNSRVLVRAGLGVLLAANLVAAIIAFKPFGGSAEDLRREEAELRQQVFQTQKRLAQTKALVAKVESARTAGDEFLTRYTTDRQTTSSIMLAELDRAAREAGIKPKPLSIVLEPVEGSDTLSQMMISAAYEGDYTSLRKFVNALDKSPRFLIIESMTAAPQATGGLISVSFKLDTFVREQPGSPS